EAVLVHLEFLALEFHNSHWIPPRDVLTRWVAEARSGSREGGRSSARARESHLLVPGENGKGKVSAHDWPEPGHVALYFCPTG
ncbi:MAG TPA: hypothetical protein PKB11_14305, partial [Desulfovibrio sp.]|uniref:hypothetical protein n=1 Tax=Desulfovibrio sp. TaxID=885 RepID=UPI002BE7025A